MEALSARRLALLVGELEGTRPPRYEALAARVRRLVADGRLPVGARLPAERELAAALGTSRATTTSAYARLREDGWATARQGAGTWTALPAAPSGAAATAAWVPAPAADGVLDLVHAAPSAPPQLHAAYASALERLPRHLPTHGYHPQGLPELRARVAERFTARGLPTTAEEVLITSGGLHAVALALEVLASRGDRLLVEHPSYPNALDTAAAQGLRAVPVAVEDDGFVADAVRTAALTSARVAYLMPDFQNPTGRLLGAVERERLAVGLRRSGTLAVVDENLVDLDLDADLGADLDAAPPQAALDPTRTATAGSLSKLAWGGLRVGWLRAERDVVQRAAALATRHRLAEPLLEQLAACALLEDVDAVRAVRREQLRERRDALVAALRLRLPDWRVDPPPGGLVLWCHLPSGRSTALAVGAEERGLRLAPGPRFGTGHAFEDRLRLPFTQPVDVLERAVEVLAQVDAEVADRPPVRADVELERLDVV